MFSSLVDKMAGALKKFRNKGKLTEADVREGMREIKLALLEADVNFKVVRDFVAKVTERAVGAEVLESLVPAQQIKDSQRRAYRADGRHRRKAEYFAKAADGYNDVRASGRGQDHARGKTRVYA